MALELLITAANYSLIGLFTLILPGFALVLVIYPTWKKLPYEVLLSIAVGLSLAFYPLLFLFAKLTGISINALTLWGVFFFCVVFLIYSSIRQWGEIRLFLKRPIQSASWTKNWHVDLLLLLVFLALGFVRFWAVRSLPVPMWGDSVHHTLIVQLLLDQGGLFDSWQPYAEMQSFTYHFGFHTTVAVYALLSGLDAAKSMLIVGQFLNVFAVLSLSVLAWRISSEGRWATIATWVLAGFIFFMPMYYTNWGRYTQLCGQVLMPIVVFLIWDLLEVDDKTETNINSGGWLRWLKQRPWRIILLVALTSSGLALVHYRVFLFMLGSIPMLMLLNISRRYWREQFADLGLGGIIGLLLYLPWFFRVYGGKLFEGFIRGITTSPSVMSNYIREYNAIGYLSGYLPLPMWVVFILCIAWALWRRDKKVLFIAGWWFTAVLMANPNWIGLPGAGLLSNFAVFLAMYIPASLIIGTAFTWLMNPVRSKKPVVADTLGIIFMMVTIAFTARSRINDVQPDPHAMATRQDIKAMEWIRENTPPESRILVNSFFAYGGSTIVGSDGGWWIPYFTTRKISVPPMPYVNEKGPFADYVSYVNSLRQMIEAKGYTHPEVIAELKARGYQYAYIGDKQGSVNYTGPVIMKPKIMIDSGYYEAVYHKGNVWILRIK